MLMLLSGASHSYIDIRDLKIQRLCCPPVEEQTLTGMPGVPGSPSSPRCPCKQTKKKKIVCLLLQYVCGGAYVFVYFYVLYIEDSSTIIESYNYSQLQREVICGEEALWADIQCQFLSYWSTSRSK